VKPPYVNKINYLSPSSLRMFEEDPNGFYLRRLGPKDTPVPETMEPSFPQSVGLSFDALVKETVAGMMGIDVPAMDETLKKIQVEPDRALGLGGRLVAHYARAGALGWLLLEGPKALEARYDGTIDGVPVRCQIDCVLRDNTPLDWKVAGANRPGQVSPAKGYSRGFDSREPGKPKAHKLVGIPLDEIDKDWATQMTIYSEILGVQTVAIDQVIVGDGYARYAQYRTTVSDKFREDVKRRLRDAWAAISEERVVDENLSVAELKALR
jgi:hypothetical protein